MRQSTKTRELSKNLRFLLWRRGVERRDWEASIGGWSGGSADRGRRLLGDDDATPVEVGRLAQRLGVTDEDLVFGDLLRDSGADILRENLDYLISSLGHGRMLPFADRLGVDRATVSCWKSGRQRPTRSHQVAMIRYFGLDAGTDLETEPLFLAMRPFGERAIRRWLHDEIDQLDADTVQALYPAFTRLFAKP